VEGAPAKSWAEVSGVCRFDHSVEFRGLRNKLNAGPAVASVTDATEAETLNHQGEAMTLSEFATFSTAISGLAVTASLIYLALQTHQNAKHTKALIHQGRIGGIREMGLAAADADIASAILFARGESSAPDDVKRFQFASFCAASLYGWQDSYSQHRMGLLDEDIYIQMRSAVAGAMRIPAFRAQWESTIRVPGTKFAAFVDEIIATLPAVRQ
jgi:hypothetical protein